MALKHKTPYRSAEKSVSVHAEYDSAVTTGIVHTYFFCKYSVFLQGQAAISKVICILFCFITAKGVETRKKLE